MRWPRLFRYLTLQIEPTTACNLDCTICMRPYIDRPDNFLSFEHFKKVLDSGSFRYVGLHGWGEPMLNKHLFEIIAYAESKRVSTNITTNGTLIQKNMDHIFSSGLKEIAFGVYDQALLSRVLPQIEDMVNEKRKRRSRLPKTYLDITMYKDNRDQIPDLLKFVRELGIDAVIFHRLFNAYNVDPALEYLSNKEEHDLFKEIRQMCKSLNLEFYLPPKHSYPCRVVKYSIFVSAACEVSPCCFLPEFGLGNALGKGVGELMRTRGYRNFARNMKSHPVCSRCQW